MVIRYLTSEEELNLAGEILKMLEDRVDAGEAIRFDAVLRIALLASSAKSDLNY